MFRPTLFTLPLLLAAGLLAGCNTMPSNDRFSVPLYEEMSATDTALADEAAQQALENLKSGKTLRWENPETGNGGSVVPVKTYYNDAKRTYCREYRELIFVGDRSERYADIACRNPRGRWVSAT